MYERQDYVLMETLFSSANYAELLNRSAYIESLAAYDRQQLEAFKQTRIEVEETEARLQKEMKDLEALKAEVEAEQSRVSGLVSSVRGKISGYQSDMAQTEDEIKAYEQQLADQKCEYSGDSEAAGRGAAFVRTGSKIGMERYFGSNLCRG